MTFGKSLRVSEPQVLLISVPGGPRGPGRTHRLGLGERVAPLFVDGTRCGGEGVGGQPALFFQGWVGQGRVRLRVCVSPAPCRWSSPRRSCSRTHPTAGSVSCPFLELRRVLGKCGAEGGGQAGSVLGAIFSGAHVSPQAVPCHFIHLCSRCVQTPHSVGLHRSKRVPLIPTHLRTWLFTLADV